MFKITSFIFLVFIFSSRVIAQHSYTIECEIINDIDSNFNHKGPLKNKNKIYLKFVNGRVDSTQIANNKFRFEGSTKFPELATVSHLNGGIGVKIDSGCYYYCKFTLTSPESGLYRYVSELTTNSEFYNYWDAVSIKALDLMARKEQLKNLIKESRVFDDELLALNNAIVALYDGVMKMPKNKTIEKIYILMGDPNFSYKKYLKFYESLTNTEKETTNGKLFFKKLQSLKLMVSLH